MLYKRACAALALALAVTGGAAGQAIGEDATAPSGQSLSQVLRERQPRTQEVSVYASLPAGASPVEIMAALEEMEEVAMAVFAADERSVNELFASLADAPSPQDGAHLLADERQAARERLRHSGGPLSCQCRADADRLCSDLLDRFQSGGSPQGGAITALSRCLLGHALELEPRCLMSLENFKVIRDCDADMDKLCPEVIPGDGRLHACLLQHRHQLSASCQAYFLDRQRNFQPLASTESGPAVVEAHHRPLLAVFAGALGVVAAAVAVLVCASRAVRRKSPKEEEEQEHPEAMEMAYTAM